MPTVKVSAFKCSVCGHIWLPVKDWKGSKPISCAKCKTPYWDRK